MRSSGHLFVELRACTNRTEALHWLAPVAAQFAQERNCSIEKAVDDLIREFRHVEKLCGGDKIAVLLFQPLPAEFLDWVQQSLGPKFKLNEGVDEVETQIATTTQPFGASGISLGGLYADNGRFMRVWREKSKSPQVVVTPAIPQAPKTEQGFAADVERQIRLEE